ncbi:hypothetical protein D3C85_1656530 [compost metagenome]
MVDRFAPGLHSVEIPLLLVNTLHTVMPNAARTKINGAHGNNPAARAPPLLQMLRLGKYFEYKLAGCIEYTFKNQFKAFYSGNHFGHF